MTDAALSGAEAPARSDDGFAAFAVPTRSGPHVTMQAAVVQAGRLTTTTSRDSLKAKVIRRRGTAAAALEHDDGTTEVLAGASVVVDLRHPEGMLTDPAGALIAGPAALRLAGDQLEQLLGYVESAGKIPAGWLPHNRVLLVTRIDRSLRLRGFEVVDGDGGWAPGDRASGERLAVEDGPVGRLPDLPDDVAHLVRTDAPARVGLSTELGPVVLPARWRGDDRFDVSAGALDLMAPHLPGAACATFDDSADRRPDRKRGVMLRGDARLVGADGERATLALRATRTTAWDGFSARTEDVRPP